MQPRRTVNMLDTLGVSPSGVHGAVLDGFSFTWKTTILGSTYFLVNKNRQEMPALWVGRTGEALPKDLRRAYLKVFDGDQQSDAVAFLLGFPDNQCKDIGEAGI